MIRAKDVALTLTARDLDNLFVLLPQNIICTLNDATDPAHPSPFSLWSIPPTSGKIFDNIPEFH